MNTSTNFAQNRVCNSAVTKSCKYV